MSLFRASIQTIAGNPFASLLVPPALFLLQFILLLLLFQAGFPHHHAQGHYLAGSLLLIAFFGSSFLSLPAAALGVRQALTLKARVVPLLGVFANLVYLVGFVLFFLIAMVLRNQS